MNNDLTLFFLRLDEAKNSSVKKSTLERITQTDLNKIYHTVCHYRVDSQADVVQQINEMQPNSAIRLSKERTGLARTLNFLRGPQGEYALMLEIKSKNNAGRKNKKKILYNGTFKSGKRALRLDECGQTTYANLVCKLGNRVNDAVMKKILYEVMYSQICKHSYVNSLWIGAFIEKPSTGIQVSLYSQEAEKGTLHDNLYQHEFRTLIKNTYESDLMMQLLKGLQHIHSKGIVHQDIKLSNIVVAEVDSAIVLQYIDLGLAEYHMQPWRSRAAMATYHYISPEIINAVNRFRYINIDTVNVAAYKKYTNILLPLLKQLEPADRPDYRYPHKANDIWALGIVFCQLLMDKLDYPKEYNDLMEHHPLVRGMMSPIRIARFDVDDSIKMLNILTQRNLVVPSNQKGLDHYLKFVLSFEKCITQQIINLLADYHLKAQSKSKNTDVKEALWDACPVIQEILKLRTELFKQLESSAITLEVAQTKVDNYKTMLENKERTELRKRLTARIPELKEIIDNILLKESIAQRYQKQIASIRNEIQDCSRLNTCSLTQLSLSEAVYVPNDAPMVCVGYMHEWHQRLTNPSDLSVQTQEQLDVLENEFTFLEKTLQQNSKLLDVHLTTLSVSLAKLQSAWDEVLLAISPQLLIMNHKRFNNQVKQQEHDANMQRSGSRSLLK